MCLYYLTKHAQIYEYICVCVCVFVSEFVLEHIYIYIYICVCVCVCVYENIYLAIYLWVDLCKSLLIYHSKTSFHGDSLCRYTFQYLSLRICKTTHQNSVLILLVNQSWHQKGCHRLTQLRLTVSREAGKELSICLPTFSIFASNRFCRSPENTRIDCQTYRYLFKNITAKSHVKCIGKRLSLFFFYFSINVFI